MFIIVLNVRPAEMLTVFRVHSWVPSCLYQICRRRGSGLRGRKAGEGWVGEIPWRRKWQPTPVFLPGKKIPWTEEPGGLQSMGLQRVGHD